MKKNFTKIFALFLILAMLCTGCGLSGAPVDSAPDGGGTPAADGKEPADGDKDVTVGLTRDVYEIPDYTNAAPGTKVLRLSVSMGASDYGTSASGVMFRSCPVVLWWRRFTPPTNWRLPRTTSSTVC